MTISSETPQQAVDSMTAAFASVTGVDPVFVSGDPTLAIFQAASIQFDYLQAVIQTVLALARAQTSTGADLDSWMAQFAFTRLPSTFAEGPVTFSANNPAVNPVNIQAATLTNGVYSGGTVIQVADGSIQYQVIPNTTLSTYNATSNSYVLAAGQTSLTASAQALVAGSAYNVSASALVQIASPLPGIDAVTNGASITNGADPESDAAFRSRFVLYLATLAQATSAAILAAALSVQQGLQVSLVENQNPGGGTVMGAFTAFVDDGSGSPPSQLITNVFNAVNAARAFSVQPFVSAPNITTGIVVITIRVAGGFNPVTVAAAVKSAITTATDALLAGATWYVSTVEGAALSVLGVTSVQPGTTLNGSNADLTPAANFEVRTAVSHITVGTY